MLNENDFRDLVRRARAGDQAAAAGLVREYEPQIRCFIRVRLTDPSLRRLFDSGDICNSVLGDFFYWLKQGRFALESPRDLGGLLGAMAQNKLNYHARKQSTAGRDKSRLDPAGWTKLDQLSDAAPGPADVVAERDFFAEVYQRLTPEERRLADLRAGGRDWGDLAAEGGMSAEALKKRFSRAIYRALHEVSHEREEG